MPPTAVDRAQQAARNNAAWCDVVCRAHGRPGELLDGLWVNRHETPPLYPNVVTLDRLHPDEHLEHIRAFMRAGVPGAWAVKDSFCTLDLAPLGFELLFEAEWIWRAAAPTNRTGDISDVSWSRIERAADLAAWEAASKAASKEEDTGERVFLPALLRDADVAVIAAHRQREIIAGAIGNRAAGAVGLSNVFVPDDAALLYWAGCIAAVSDGFPRLPLVGYESGETFAVARTLGFEPVGRLRVWSRQAGS